MPRSAEPAGSPSYETEHGPDGRTYVVGGEVAIDVSPEQTPSATIAKAEQVERTALAPADPSPPQDVRVAVATRQMRAEAQAELVKLQAEELNGREDGEETGITADTNQDVDQASPLEQTRSSDRQTADNNLTAQRAYEQSSRLVGSLVI
ncbi:putative metalloprotease CJM1_0395 family protein [Breoghania sp.]|uniref:putative metalloprotease CJM1_0395 family protein n=1 Tax=Breoghania sp. TaxID=2065378 RepID=UPI00261A1C36|nr:putative metalloprotease CJM1_0395 family protein [Breoghania sp.]MDJ0930431.1 putative metalloprotease CJM1_0395 family protein [Breoghania sp.]